MRLINLIKENFPRYWGTRLVIAVLLLLSFVAAALASGMSRDFVAGMAAVSLPGDPVLPMGTQDDDERADSLPFAAELEAVLPDPDPWDGTSRVNILVLGLDLREDATVEEDAPLSDTMILVSLDPLNDTASAIAIPRDMWVVVPGFGYYKINTAFRLGTRYNVPGSGPGLASRTVEEFLGVPVP